MPSPRHDSGWGADRSPRRSRLPRWLAPALGLWVVLGAVALANASAVPVRGRVVFALLCVLALAHGLIHRRWWIAGPAVLAFAVLALLLEHVPGFASIVRSQGPGGDIAPRIIWVAAFTVATLDIAWGLLVDARNRRVAGHSDGAARLDQLARQEAATEAEIRRSLANLEDQIADVERHLTTVP